MSFIVSTSIIPQFYCLRSYPKYVLFLFLFPLPILSFCLFLCSSLCRHKIPPRNLINLARRYHSEITLQPLMAKSSSITLLQPPPAWALASLIESSACVLFQNHEESTPTFKLNRHQRKNRRKQLGISSSSIGGNGISCSGISSLPGGISLSTIGLLILRSSTSDDDLVTCIKRARTLLVTYMDTCSSSNYIQAIIASGTGPDGLVEARKARKRRRFIVQSVALLIISMLFMTAKQKWKYSTLMLGDGQEGGEEGHRRQLKLLNNETLASVVEEESNPCSKLSSCTSENLLTTFENNNNSNDTCGALDDLGLDNAASSGRDLAVTQMNITSSKSRTEISSSVIDNNVSCSFHIRYIIFLHLHCNLLLHVKLTLFVCCA